MTKSISPLALALINSLESEKTSQALIDVAIDFFLDAKIESWLDLEILYEGAQSIYQPSVVARMISKSLPTAIERSKGLIDTQGQNLQAWLTPDLDAELRSVLAGAQLLTSERVDRFVRHPITHHVIQSFVEETLQRFISRVKPGGEGGGLIGSASRGALGWAAKASRGALSGLSEQLQQQLSGLTQDFISASMHVLLDQLGHIISAPEVSLRLNEVLLSLYDDIRTQSPHQLLSLLSELFEGHRDSELDPLRRERMINEWSTLISEWIAHLLEQTELEAIVGRLHQELIREVGQKSLRELIGDEASVHTFKESARLSLAPQLISFVGSDHFSEWCIEHLG